MTAGRPEIPLEWDRVEEMLMAGCLGTEVAAYFNMAAKTLYERVEKVHGMGFTQFRAEKMAKGNISLKEAQYNKAIGKNVDGDNTMLIWLGKIRLEQRETENHDALKRDHNQFRKEQESKYAEENGSIPEAT